MKSRNYFQCAGQCCHSTCQLKAALIWAPTEQITQACDAPSLQLAAHPSRNLQLSHVLSGWRRRREVTTSGWRKIKGTCSVWRKGAWQWAIDSFCNIRILTIWTSLCIIFVFLLKAIKLHLTCVNFLETCNSQFHLTLDICVTKRCQYMVPRLDALHSRFCLNLDFHLQHIVCGPSGLIHHYHFIFGCSNSPTISLTLGGQIESLIFRHPHFHFSLKQKHEPKEIDLEHESKKSWKWEIENICLRNTPPGILDLWRSHVGNCRIKEIFMNGRHSQVSRNIKTLQITWQKLCWSCSTLRHYSRRKCHQECPFCFWILQLVQQFNIINCIQQSFFSSSCCVLL